MEDLADTRLIAAELTRLESSPRHAIAALGAMDIYRGKVTVVTGSPGAGKSSLIHRLLEAFAERGERVGAILIDPCSSVTGGAVLGDRVRMLDCASDDKIFIRSVAARTGAESVGVVAPVMAWTLLNRGFGHVFIESVGIGQQELDVSRRGEVLSLVLGPDSGDLVQFIKSGVLDLCDVIAVSKADLGAVSLINEIRLAVDLQSFRAHPVPVVPVSSRSGAGVGELIAEIDAAHDMSAQRRAASRAAVVRDIVTHLVMEETRARFDICLKQEGDADGWRSDLATAMRFIDLLPSSIGRGHQ